MRSTFFNRYRCGPHRRASPTGSWGILFAHGGAAEGQPTLKLGRPQVWANGPRSGLREPLFESRRHHSGIRTASRDAVLARGLSTGGGRPSSCRPVPSKRHVGAQVGLVTVLDVLRSPSASFTSPLMLGLERLLKLLLRVFVCRSDAPAVLAGTTTAGWSPSWLPARLPAPLRDGHRSSARRRWVSRRSRVRPRRPVASSPSPSWWPRRGLEPPPRNRDDDDHEQDGSRDPSGDHSLALVGAKLVNDRSRAHGKFQLVQVDRGWGRLRRDAARDVERRSWLTSVVLPASVNAFTSNGELYDRCHARRYCEKSPTLGSPFDSAIAGEPLAVAPAC